MNALTSILGWILSKTMFGIVGISVVVYVVFLALRKVFRRLPDPALIAGPVFLIALFTFPSLPRYQFERDVMAKIEGKDWIRVVNKAKSGSLTEPLTLLRTPVSSVTIIMPDSPIVVGVFRQVTMTYEAETTVLIVEPDCADLTIAYARPDKKGVVRYTKDYASKMDDREKGWYCQHDWSKEMEALRKEALRQMKEP